MTLQLISSAAQLRTFADERRASGQVVSVVPTMGALHAGHLALVREAGRRSDVVVVTIFVNPTQFGPGEDFDLYPRDLERDLELAESAGAHVAFAPSVQEMYPDGEQTRVTVSQLSQGLCGASRPRHFDGVTTIVAKLFHAVGPCVAVFGRKDYQQLRVIERMVRDLLFPVEVVGHPIVREADGLALSSRNRYLSEPERRRALSIPRALGAANHAFSAGERSATRIRESVRGALDRAQMRVDYVELVSPETLMSFEDGAELAEETLLAVAALVGTTRLIDNILLGRDASPEVPHPSAFPALAG